MDGGCHLGANDDKPKWPCVKLVSTDRDLLPALAPSVPGKPPQARAWKLNWMEELPSDHGSGLGIEQKTYLLGMCGVNKMNNTPKGRRSRAL